MMRKLQLLNLLQADFGLDGIEIPHQLIQLGPCQILDVFLLQALEF